jgi:hypothetical protein
MQQGMISLTQVLQLHREEVAIEDFANIVLVISSKCRI